MGGVWNVGSGLRRMLHDGLGQARDAVKTGKTNFLAPSFPAMTAPGDCRLVEAPRLPEPHSKDGQENIERWPDRGLLSKCWPVVLFLLDGECDIRFGIRGDEHRQLEALPDGIGEFIVTMKAKQFLLMPSRFARTDGTDIHWERSDRERASSTLMWLIFDSVGCFVHFCKTSRGKHVQSSSIYLAAPQVFRLSEDLEDEILSGRYGWDAAARSYLEIILIMLQRQAAHGHHEAGLSFNQKPADHHDSHVADKLHRDLQKACDFIEEQLQEPLLSWQIVRSTGVSSRRLNELFSEHLSTTVSQYIIGRRIARASSLLRDSNLSVRVVATQSGFARVEHFTRTFKKHAGVSPLAYRRQYREGG